MGKLLDELKRCKIFPVAAVYVVVAWLIIQVTGKGLPTFNAPQWIKVCSWPRLCENSGLKKQCLNESARVNA